jgi:hypothetical protein
MHAYCAVSDLGVSYVSLLGIMAVPLYSRVHAHTPESPIAHAPTLQVSRLDTKIQV